jgi:GNAT superfamily N-acetyltransferase
MSSNSEKIALRDAQLADIPALHRIRLSVKENALSGPEVVKPGDYEDFLTNRGKGWLFEIDKQVIGFAIVDLKDHNVWALFIHPSFEQQGIGRILHDVMMNWYFDQTDHAIWLSTEPKTRAENFYRKAGWRQTGFTSSGEIRFEMTDKDWRKAQGGRN